MRTLGVEATIFVNEKNRAEFLRQYKRFDWVDKEVKSFVGPKDLGNLVADLDLVVATTNTSTHSIHDSLKSQKGTVRTAYYIQDYEPLFYETESESWNLAVTSFGLLKGCTYFAKTRWLRDIVHAVHQLPVSVVTPSIDFAIYNPTSYAIRKKKVVCAMVRPQTPRRAPKRTLRVLGRLLEKYRSAVEVLVFGADKRDFAQYGLPEYSDLRILGALEQSEVAAVLQAADFFLDLSDYQAFGRTAAEAMACGCIALAPTLGGASDFIVNGRNSFLVDTRDEGKVFAQVEKMIEMTEQEIRVMRIQAIESVAHFTPISAALSELRAFGFA